jgi:hypothetical protein
VRVILEVFVCAAESDEKVRYCRLQTEMTYRHCDPDDIVCEALSDIGLQPDQSGCCAHSTSWRYDSGQTLLTYLVWVPLRDMSALDTRVLELSRVTYPAAEGPLKPRPRDIREEHVLVHGLRHLRFLVENQPACVNTRVIAAAEVFNVLQRMPPAVAGRLA